MSEVIADEFDENSVVPCVFSFYSNEKSVKERFRTRIPICFKKHTTLNGFKQHLIDFAGIKEHAASIGVGSFELKLYRLDTKTNTNYIYFIQTQKPVGFGETTFIHVIQKIVNWSGNTIVLVEECEALPVSTNRKLKTNRPFRKRRSKQEEAEYNDLVKKIKIGENFERTERQKEDFETFCKDLSLLVKKIRFRDPQPYSVPIIPCDGIPFVVVGRKLLECHQGIDRDGHRKEKRKIEKQKNPIVGDAFDNNDILNVIEKEEMLEEDPYAAIVDPSNYDNKIVDNNLYDIGKEDDVHDSLHDLLEHPIQELTSDERQVISDVSMDGSCCSGDDSVFEDAHPLAKKLQDCITEGKLTEESFMYKYLTDVCKFAMKNVKYLGGQKSFNFVRGPGFLGPGRGGIKHVNTLSDFNLCGPSTHALRKCQAGFSTKSGVYSSLMNAFYQNALLEKALVPPLFSSDTVHIIPCCLADDGTALKPGLEYDNTHHCVVGLTDSLNADYIKANPIANNLHLKSQMVTEADVSFLTSLDNGASMPIGVHYLPKSFSGEQMKDMFIETALSVQICASCLVDCIKTNISIVNKNIVQDVCISHCQSCWDTQELCEQCMRLGHVSYYPALRSCSKCTDKGIKCVKVAVFSLVTDCEEHNKKVMESFDEVKLQNPSLNQAVRIPDCVHVGKSLKCSWANWFIIVENCRTNLVFMRTLRDHGDAHLKAELCKLLSLECVRNKDRMAVDPILRLTAAQINELLTNVEYVIHTVVPETYKYWKSNLSNTYAHPVGICTGPSGFLLAIDILDEETACGRLLEIRLHYPADVKVLQNLTDP
ncbi:unnamed protein product [Mytilus coruscus]|uniref:Uncharacterized protein n=1 Tax=Mytilus coruscus TaxID=42192 RepID=A0A6J8D9I9_MYTCO|nr:unnamed protein product [Mytilus coruscus]